jgi:hypothetical protein
VIDETNVLLDEASATALSAPIMRRSRARYCGITGISGEKIRLFQPYRLATSMAICDTIIDLPSPGLPVTTTNWPSNSLKCGSRFGRPDE